MSDGQANNKPSDASPINGLPPPRDTRWKKGQSGNPKGRPRKRRIEDALAEQLAGEVDGINLLDAMAKIAIRKSLKGDAKFWQMVTERTSGKVPDKVENDGKVRIEVRYVTEADDDADDQPPEADAGTEEDQA